MAIEKIGFIGLGTMGNPMARRILEKGYPLSVYDICQEAIEELVGAGAIGCASPEEVAGRSDAICTIVPDSPEVEEVILGEQGILRGAQPGKIIIEMSTIDPNMTKSLAQRVSKAELRMIDAPVCRSYEHAKRGELLILIGGSKEDYEECRPILGCMGNTFYYCGEIGAGLTMKLINNMMLGDISLAVCEGLTLGVKAGLDFQQIMEVLSGTMVSNKIMEVMFPEYAFKGNFEPGFALDWAHKDIGHALRVAATLGSPCPVASMVHTFQNIARSQGKGRWDHTAIITVFEEIIGVKLCAEKSD